MSRGLCASSPAGESQDWPASPRSGEGEPRFCRYRNPLHPHSHRLEQALSTQSQGGGKRAQREGSHAAAGRVRMKGEAGSRPWGPGSREAWRGPPGGAGSCGGLGAGRGVGREGADEHRSESTRPGPGPAPALAPTLPPPARRPGGLRRPGLARPRALSNPAGPAPSWFLEMERSGQGCGVRREGLRGSVSSLAWPFSSVSTSWQNCETSLSPRRRRSGSESGCRRRPPGRAALPHAAAPAARAAPRTPTLLLRASCGSHVAQRKPGA